MTRRHCKTHNRIYRNLPVTEYLPCCVVRVKIVPSDLKRVVKKRV